MIISNFRNLKIVERSVADKIAYADVDVTTGFWLWKKTKTEIVFNDSISGNKAFFDWRWIHSGEYAPEVKHLYRKYIDEQDLNSK